MKTILLVVYFFSVALLGKDVFVVSNRIKADVDFWKRVYAEWDNHQVVFYDSQTKFVYDVINLPKVDNEISSPKYKKLVEQRYNDIIGILNRMVNHSKKASDGALATQIYSVVKKHSLLKEKDLANRMRYQNGLRGQFAYGLKVSGLYADDMKAVLRSQGLPDDLLAVVFVESLFYISAISHAGACGPWGFVRETAINSGIHVNKFTDERLDPVISTWAAARYLNKAKAGLLEWPLAITSYNYGYSGMMRAVNNLGTRDFDVILANHQSPLFGYASQNYYAEFLAAREILLHQEKYFPDVKKERAWTYQTVQVLRPVLATDLVRFDVIGTDSLIALNPGLTKHTVLGNEVIPPEYALRIPPGRSKSFYQQIKKIPDTRRSAAAHKISSKYMAKGRESLRRIARIFGISAEFLSERMGKPLDYQPLGPVLIRSQAHLFSPLLEINQNMLSASATKPKEINQKNTKK